jgi:hypothetical protein
MMLVRAARSGLVTQIFEALIRTSPAPNVCSHHTTVPLTLSLLVHSQLGVDWRYQTHNERLPVRTMSLLQSP